MTDAETIRVATEALREARERIEVLEAALQTAATRFDMLAAHDDTIRNGVKPSAGYADCMAALKPSN